MADLFDRDKSVVSKHIKNIFEERELTENRTVAKFATVQKEGSREISRDIEYFNLNGRKSVGASEEKETNKCFYHAWFIGKPLRPVDNIISVPLTTV